MQRYLAKKMYTTRFPGGASTPDLAWPVVQNYGVFRPNGARFYQMNLWLDQNQAPIRKS